MLRSRRSTGRLNACWCDSSQLEAQGDIEEDFPANAEEYVLLEEIGQGATARVWMSRCKSNDTTVAIKLIDLEKYQGNTELEQLIKEAHIMKGFKHPNLLPLYCSFIHDSDLWLVMPFIAGGSLGNILTTRFPEGLEEDAIATIARDVLEGLEYLHMNDSMHRDLKAANLLVADEGHILLADFGACATLEREARLPSLHSAFQQSSTAATSGSPSAAASPSSPGLPSVSEDDSNPSWSAVSTPSFRSSVSATSSQWAKYLSRNTFIGTACYMAPEVMDPREGYSQSADMWSFGILVLELAKGKTPHSDCSFTRLVLSTVHDPAPQLKDNCGSHQYSPAMHDFVAKCLDKDAMARSGAADLLQHPFLKRAKDESFLAQLLLGGRGALKTSRTFHARTMHSRASGSASSTTMQMPQPPTAPATPKMAKKTSWKAQNAARSAAVFQIVWTAYSSGRKFLVVFHMTKSHSEARIMVNGVELLRRKYKLWQQMNFHSDCFKLTVDAPQLRQLAGKSLQLDVRTGFAIMTGQAILDGTVLDEPQCMATYADMSPPQPAAAALPGIPAASPFSQAAALSITPRQDSGAPSVGLSSSLSVGDLSGKGDPSGKQCTADPSGRHISFDPALRLSASEEGFDARKQAADALQAAPSAPQQPVTQAVSEENLARLDQSAGQRIASALERLHV